MKFTNTETFLMKYFNIVPSKLIMKSTSYLDVKYTKLHKYLHNLQTVFASDDIFFVKNLT